VRAVAQGDGQHLVGDRHLQVQGLAGLGAQLAQRGDVGIGDVAAILAQMGGDAVGAGRQGLARRADRIGMDPAAGVAHGGHVIDVDAEADGAGHRRFLFRYFASRRLPGSSTGRAASSAGRASAG
jgi:hypothetical protein